MTNESPATSENPSGDGQPVKTAKQLEKEAQKAAKLAKFEQKKAAQGAQQPSAPKEKVEVSFFNSSLNSLISIHYSHVACFFFFAEKSESYKGDCL
jgi:hypothetical protein